MTETNIQTGDIVIDQKLDALFQAINLSNLKETHSIIADLNILSIKNAPLAKWITVPANLISLQELLSEKFKIEHKMLQLKTRVQNRQRRAVMLLKAMNNALTKISEST